MNSLAAILCSLALAIGGMLLLSWIFHLDILKTGWRAAAKDLPDFARERGLVFEASTLSHQMGAVRGQWDGHEVYVLPDESATLGVELRSAGRVILATFDPKNASISDELVEFSTGNAAFDGFFKTRFAAADLVPRLKESDELHRIVSVGLAPKKWSLRFCYIGDDDIDVSVKHGRATYIPIELAEEMLPVLVQLADWIEAADGR